MHERTNIQLNRADRHKLEAVVANRNSPQKHVWRANIVLLTAAGHGTAEIMQATGKAKTVIWRWQERFRDEGAAGLWRDKTRRSRIPPLSPEVAKRVVALTLAGPPPAGSHWSYQTAYLALVDRGAYKAGETVLVGGACCDPRSARKATVSRAI